MSREQNWYIRRYVRAVSTFLPCSGKRKKPWLADLRAQAESYVAEGGDAAALEQRFGTPQQMAFSYVDEMSTADLLAELHIRRRLVAVTAITLAPHWRSMSLCWYGRLTLFTTDSTVGQKRM